MASEDTTKVSPAVHADGAPVTERSGQRSGPAGSASDSAGEELEPRQARPSRPTIRYRSRSGVLLALVALSLAPAIIFACSSSRQGLESVGSSRNAAVVTPVSTSSQAGDGMANAWNAQTQGGHYTNTTLDATVHTQMTLFQGVFADNSKLAYFTRDVSDAMSPLTEINSSTWPGIPIGAGYTSSAYLSPDALGFTGSPGQWIVAAQATATGSGNTTTDIVLAATNNQGASWNLQSVSYELQNCGSGLPGTCPPGSMNPVGAIAIAVDPQTTHRGANWFSGTGDVNADGDYNDIYVYWTEDNGSGLDVFLYIFFVAPNYYGDAVTTFLLTPDLGPPDNLASPTSDSTYAMNTWNMVVGHQMGCGSVIQGTFVFGAFASVNPYGETLTAANPQLAAAIPPCSL